MWGWKAMGERVLYRSGPICEFVALPQCASMGEWVWYAGFMRLRMRGR
jgi:hypothetical protein